MKPRKASKGGGARFLLLPERKAPLVHLEIALRTGSLRDPEGKEGVSSLVLSMLLRGTLRRSSREFHQALDDLGAEIHLGKYKESLRIYGICLSEKLPQLLGLLEELLVEPAFSAEELEKVRSLMRSALLDELGSDDEIADRRFQEYMLWGNPYGRMSSGSLPSLERVTVDDLREFHRGFFRQADFVVGACGGFDRKRLTADLKRILARLPAGSAGLPELKAPEFRKGKVLLLLDKAERSQAQIHVGAPGVSFTDPDYFPMLIANHIFGGSSFSARLMKEVREKRGWSYGCYSWYRSGRLPLYFAMHAVPSNKDAIPALRLMLRLFGEYARKGVTRAEFDFAKKSLVSQAAFLQDTLRKKLDNQVTEAVMDLPKGFYDGYQKRLQKIRHTDVQRAIRRHVQPRRIFAQLLGSADALGLTEEALKGFVKVWKRDYQAEAGDLDAEDPYIVRVRGEARKAESSASP